jgi:hypothetical protein
MWVMICLHVIEIVVNQNFVAGLAHAPRIMLFCASAIPAAQIEQVIVTLFRWTGRGSKGISKRV